MKEFKSFRMSLAEKRVSHGINEETVGTMKVGKGKKYTALIKKEDSKYVAYIDGDELDKFKSEEEARQGIKDFIELMDM